jgi:hypothetical protein
MNAFMFVSIVCFGQSCGFFTSPDYVSEAKCKQYKEEFLQRKFKPEVTLATCQCMKLNPGVQI